MKTIRYISALLLIVLYQSVTLTASADRYALVIGIGAYPAEGGWKAINGDKDVPLVQSTLIANGFQQQDIATLVNAEATYDAICLAFERLIDKASAEDVVYIHFSGHGQQITDTNGDEEDGLDEAWVSYDARLNFEEGVYEGEHHLVDDQLNSYLHRLREKVGEKGKIIVVADACHSGGSTRDLNDGEAVVTRGVREVFRKLLNRTGTEMEYQSYPVEWMVLSACKPYQTNYEYEGKGSLTYAIFNERENFGAMTPEQLLKKVKSVVGDVVPYVQTPVLETPAGTEQEPIL